MIRAAQVVPQNVEKLPLHRWRPGARALVVGARDGVAFDGRDERGSFVRALPPDVIVAAARKARVDAIAAWWSESLRDLDALRALIAIARDLRLPLIVGSAGHGDAQALTMALDAADAWVLFVGDPGPHAAAIIARGRHVEVVVGLAPRAPALGLAIGAAAAHLVPRRAAAAPDDLERWIAEARAALPPSLPIYTSAAAHDDCACGARLVWRAGGASRVDALDLERLRCRICDRPVAIAR